MTICVPCPLHTGSCMAQWVWWEAETQHFHGTHILQEAWSECQLKSSPCEFMLHASGHSYVCMALILRMYANFTHEISTLEVVELHLPFYLSHLSYILISFLIQLGNSALKNRRYPNSWLFIYVFTHLFTQQTSIKCLPSGSSCSTLGHWATNKMNKVSIFASLLYSRGEQIRSMWRWLWMQLLMSM